MTAILHLDDSTANQRPENARMYAVGKESDEVVAIALFNARYNRVPDTVYVWRGNAYIELREGER